MSMPLRRLAKLTPVSDRTKKQFVSAMNSNPICVIEDRRSDGRTFFSSQENPEFWIWSDGADDPHWRYEILAR